MWWSNNNHDRILKLFRDNLTLSLVNIFSIGLCGYSDTSCNGYQIYQRVGMLVMYYFSDLLFSQILLSLLQLIKNHRWILWRLTLEIEPRTDAGSSALYLSTSFGLSFSRENTYLYILYKNVLFVLLFINSNRWYQKQVNNIF